MAKPFDWKRLGYALGRGLQTYGTVALAREEEDRRYKERETQKAESEKRRQEDIAREEKWREEDKADREAYRSQQRIDQLGREIRAKQQRQIETQAATSEKRISERKAQKALLDDPRYLYHLYLLNPADPRISPTYRAIFAAETAKTIQGNQGGGQSNTGRITDKEILSEWNKLEPQEKKKYQNNIGIYARIIRSQLSTGDFERDFLGGNVQTGGPQIQQNQTPGVNAAQTTDVAQAKPVPEGIYNQVISGLYKEEDLASMDELLARANNPPPETTWSDQDIESLMAGWESNIKFGEGAPIEAGPGIKIIHSPDGPKIDITEAVDTAKEKADPNYLSPQKEYMLNLLKIWNSGQELTPQQQLILDSLVTRYKK